AKERRMCMTRVSAGAHEGCIYVQDVRYAAGAWMHRSGAQGCTGRYLLDNQFPTLSTAYIHVSVLQYLHFRHPWRSYAACVGNTQATNVQDVRRSTLSCYLVSYEHHILILVNISYD
ncbi:MAG: hypothetical protein HW411_867, partial [Gammaproteobacteria bacterium]|nr:hypothetical protein [Gammaproteobacteria bacterium]